MLCFGCIRCFSLVVTEPFGLLLGARFDCLHTQEESNHTIISKASVLKVEEYLFVTSDDYDHCGIAGTITLLFANIFDVVEGQK